MAHGCDRSGVAFTTVHRTVSMAALSALVEREGFLLWSVAAAAAATAAAPPSALVPVTSEGPTLYSRVPPPLVVVVLLLLGPAGAPLLLLIRLVALLGHSENSWCSP
jgi:hypothetical protein